MERTNSIDERGLNAEIKHYVALAVPMILSLWTDPVMHFFDRLFLSHYKEGMGEVYLNSSLTGSLISFAFIIFFSSLTGYTNSLISQFIGAEKQKECGKIVAQAMLLSFYALPIFFLGWLFIDDIVLLFNHSELQTMLEVKYARMLLYGALIVLMRSAIVGFFTAIGKTNIVMKASVITMLCNIPLNYCLIYGAFGLPEMGIEGAALATVISALIGFIVLYTQYFSYIYHHKYHTRVPLTLHLPYMKKLIRFGLPSAIEIFIGFSAFSIFIFAMSSYSKVVGASVTIAINWDSNFFIPMLGASFATTAIVGQYLGAKKIQRVYRIIGIAFLLKFTFLLVLVYLFVFQYDMLISIFIKDMEHSDQVYMLTKQMLRLVSVYLAFDATSLIIASVLRAAGDTRALMIIMFVVDALFIITVAVFVIPQRVSPIQAWWIFIGFPVSIAVAVTLRFLQGKWKHIDMIS